MKNLKTNPRIGAVLIALLFVATTAFSQTCPSGMLSYWRLQESGSSVYADELGNHDATASSSPTVTTGISGKGQTLSTGKELVIADHSDFDWPVDGSFSIELWAKFVGTGATNPEVIIGRDDPSTQLSWWLGRTNTGNIRWSVRSNDGTNNSVTSAGVYNNGTWVHIVVVHDGTNITLYTNGVSATTTQTYTGDLEATGAAPIVIGDLRATDNQYSFNGVIDEVAIYNSDISSLVTDHMNDAKDYEIGYCDGDAPVYLTTPVTTASVGDKYEYDVDVSGNPKPTLELVAAPDGMTINSEGLIEWTPASLNVNGNVVVRATSGANTLNQSFIVSIADAPVCRTNMIEYWDLNSNSLPIEGNVIGDTLTNTLDATTLPSITEGIVGNALSFNGSSDGVAMEDPEYKDASDNTIPVWFDFEEPGVVGAKSFSFEFWAKTPNSASDVMVMLGRYVSADRAVYWVGVETDGTVSAYFRGYSGSANLKKLTSTSTITDNQWHQIVVTYDEASPFNFSLYIDGTLEASAEFKLWNFGGGGPLTLGYLNTISAKEYYFSGSLDEVTVYDYALHADSVSKYYNSGSPLGSCESNYAPVITSVEVTEATEDIAYTYNIEGYDADGDEITLSTPTLPSWLTFDYTPGETTASITGTPGDAEVGTHDVTVRISDGSLDVDQTFQIEVVNVNDAPVITSGMPSQLAVLTDSSWSYTIEATDEDLGQTVTYIASQYPSWLSFDSPSATLSGKPGLSDLGEHDVLLIATDGITNDSVEFTITVQASNQNPSFTSSPVTVADDYEPYTYTVTATDPDGNELTFAVTSTLPEWLTFDAETGVLAGTPKYDAGGTTLDVIISVTDGIAEVLQSFTIHISDNNDDPLFTSTPVDTARVGDEYLYVISASDVDENDVLTFSAIVIPSWLTLETVNDSVKLYGTPATENIGTDNNTVIIQLSDGDADVLQNFTIDVAGDGSAINNLKANLINSAYPNPATSNITIDFKEFGNYSIVILDMKGSIQSSYEIKGDNYINIDLSNLNSGIYYYKVVSEGKIDVGRFSKL